MNHQEPPTTPTSSPPLPLPLSYAAPAPPAASRPWISWPIFRSAVILAGLIWVDLGLLTPKFEHIFKNFKVQLPQVTAAQLYASRVFGEYHLWLPLLVMALALPVVVPLLSASPRIGEPLPQSRGLRWFTILAVLLIIVFSIIALFMPMIHLIQEIAASTAK